MIAIYSCQVPAGGAGLASCIGSVASGHPISTARPGLHTFSVIARDKAGNIDTVVIRYTVDRKSRRRRLQSTP